MSENEVDNNEVTDKEMIEAEVVDSVDEGQQEMEPVVVKKGGFLSFLAFVLSLVAIGISSYLYYLQVYSTKQEKNNTPWKQAIANLQQQSASQVNALKQQLTGIQNLNQKLTEQLSTLEEKAQQSNTQTMTATTDSAAFDDNQLKQQISDLTQQLNAQQQNLQQLQEKLNSNTSQMQTSLSLVKKEISAKIANQSNTNHVINPVDNNKAIAGSLLQEAYLQLNIHGNRNKAQDLLNKSIEQLNQLTGMRYGRLANELETFSQQLADIEQTDTDALKTQIKHLSEQTHQLVFINAKKAPETKEKSSWYNNLISIKKIDAKQQPKLTKSEQITIRNVLNSHYQMLNLALIGNNQELWDENLSKLQDLLNKHFAGNASDIIRQLSELKNINIQTQLPDLLPFVQKFQAITLANENE